MDLRKRLSLTSGYIPDWDCLADNRRSGHCGLQFIGILLRPRFPRQEYVSDESSDSGMTWINIILDFDSTNRCQIVLRRIEDDRGDSLPDKITTQKVLYHLKDWVLWAHGEREC